MKLSHVAASLVLVTLAAMGSVHAASPTLRAIENEFIQLSEQLAPSVVEISAKNPVNGESMEGLDDLFRFFGQPPQPDAPQRQQPQTPQWRTSTGSGFIYDRHGHIVTNNHVVDGADSLEVHLWDGTARDATVVGTDPSADLAVIKIDPAGLNLSPIVLGDSDQLKVGQFAVAMGSPSHLTGTVSFGHVSGLGREQLRLPDPNLRFQSFIQTDAAINLGNSGGPLCNIDGEVIGVNIAIVFGANSIGFAIPANRVKEVVPQLIDVGRVVRGWLGVSILNVDEAAQEEKQDVEDYVDAYALPDERGAVIYQATPEGPAEKAGLVAEDVIRKIDGHDVEDKQDLIERISDFRPGTEVALEVWRSGKARNMKVVLGEFPRDIATARYGNDILGLRVADVPANLSERAGVEEEITGVLVVDVVSGSPAAEAGLARGHVIVEVAHVPVTSVESFKQLIRENAAPNKTLLVSVLENAGETDKKFLKVPADFVAP